MDLRIWQLKLLLYKIVLKVKILLPGLLGPGLTPAVGTPEPWGIAAGAVIAGPGGGGGGAVTSSTPSPTYLFKFGSHRI